MVVAPLLKSHINPWDYTGFAVFHEDREEIQKLEQILKNRRLDQTTIEGKLQSNCPIYLHLVPTLCSSFQTSDYSSALRCLYSLFVLQKRGWIFKFWPILETLVLQHNINIHVYDVISRRILILLTGGELSANRLRRNFNWVNFKLKLEKEFAHH